MGGCCGGGGSSEDVLYFTKEAALSSYREVGILTGIHRLNTSSSNGGQPLAPSVRTRRCRRGESSNYVGFATANLLLVLFSFLYEGLISYRARLDARLAAKNSL